LSLYINLKLRRNIVAKVKAPGVDIARGLELLGRALQIEYSMIVQYPQFAERISDEEIKRQVIALGVASTKHADVVSQAITKLGGTPEWSFEFVDRNTDLLDIFTRQLEKERLALELHQQAASLLQDDSLGQEFAELAEEEKLHIRAVEKIIAALK
jgi:rubrerythrin